MSTPHPSGEDLSEIRLTLPALAAYARVARLALTGLATRNGFTYDEVEDLRIAVGEVMGMLVGAAEPASHVRFTCQLSDEALRIRSELVPAQPLEDVGELSTLILGSIVDESTIEAPAGRITITKRAEAAR